MANEISFSGSLNFSRSGASASISASVSASQVGADFTQQSQVVGTSAEQLAIGGDVGTLGYLMVKNNDPTNFVELALDSAVSTQIFAKLRPGEFCLLPPATGTLYAKADTAPCSVSVLAIEL